MRFRFSLSGLVVIILCSAIGLISSCKKDSKDCPAFPDNLLPYIPNESRLMFYNANGDSLLFRTDVYDKTEQHTMTRNRLSVGGTGAKPYCVASCAMNSSLLSSDANQIGYTIKVDNEADTVSLSLSIASALSTNDYFLRGAHFTPSGRPFGDTLQLSNSTPTTNPRFSQVTIVYGRGIVSLTDDVQNCVWVR
ncbi:MAG: hypothetical protein ACK478_00930 [Flavobacteriales bacterium]|jgi:hypothetical protein